MPTLHAPAPVRISAWVLVSALALAGCAAPPRPAPAAEAARIRAACPEGTFIGAMTVNCPEVTR